MPFQSGVASFPGLLRAPADAGGAARAPLTVPELHEALANGWVSARYQPVVRMADRRPVALEVLARVEHPARGTLTPDLFIPQMEDAGLAWPLTQSITRRAFAEWGSGRLQQFGLALALNVPLDVLLMPEALDWLDATRAQADIPPTLITVELTESRPLTQLDALTAAARRLHDAGYEMAIDDVGPTVRDHRELLSMAFSVLKLDKDLVRSSESDPAANTFLMDSIAAARAARLTIIAEGVEDEAVWARMAALGIEQAQGFLIARPLPAAQIPAWLDGWAVRGG
jgi:EAL domain-containing protein (putative c-di-GMP-specific phosphodiesterase class I)